MDIIMALERAINEEKRSGDKYREMAREAGDAETRLLLEQLAREEDMHNRKLSERLKALKLMG